jgi:hypothetical protein
MGFEASAGTVSAKGDNPDSAVTWILSYALVVQKQERGLQPSLTRTHYSAGRVAALVSMPPNTRSAAQTRHLDAFLRFCPKAHQLRRFVLQF